MKILNFINSNCAKKTLVASFISLSLLTGCGGNPQDKHLGQVFVQDPSGQTRVIDYKDNDNLSEIRSKIRDTTGIIQESQLLTVSGRPLTSMSQLDSGTSIDLSCRVRGGSEFIFADFDENNSCEKKFDSTAPKWRYISPGLNLEGKCENPNCEANGRLVWCLIKGNKGMMYGQGYDEKANEIINGINIGDIRGRCTCPVCHQSVESRTVLTMGFYKCYYDLVGKEYVNNGYIINTGKKTDSTTGFVYFNRDKTIELDSLIVSTRPLNYQEIKARKEAEERQRGVDARARRVSDQIARRERQARQASDERARRDRQARLQERQARQASDERARRDRQARLQERQARQASDERARRDRQARQAAEERTRQEIRNSQRDREALQRANRARQAAEERASRERQARQKKAQDLKAAEEWAEQEAIARIIAEEQAEARKKGGQVTKDGSIKKTMTKKVDEQKAEEISMQEAIAIIIAEEQAEARKKGGQVTKDGSIKKTKTKKVAEQEAEEISMQEAIARSLVEENARQERQARLAAEERARQAVEERARLREENQALQREMERMRALLARGNHNAIQEGYIPNDDNNDMSEDSTQEENDTEIDPDEETSISEPPSLSIEESNMNQENDSNSVDEPGSLSIDQSEENDANNINESIEENDDNMDTEENEDKYLLVENKQGK